jgi:hypothetical protein
MNSSQGVAADEPVYGLSRCKRCHPEELLVRLGVPLPVGETELLFSGLPWHSFQVGHLLLHCHVRPCRQGHFKELHRLFLSGVGGGAHYCTSHVCSTLHAPVLVVDTACTRCPFKNSCSSPSAMPVSVAADWSGLHSSGYQSPSCWL